MHYRSPDAIKRLLDFNLHQNPATHSESCLSQTFLAKSLSALPAELLVQEFCELPYGDTLNLSATSFQMRHSFEEAEWIYHRTICYAHEKILNSLNLATIGIKLHDLMIRAVYHEHLLDEAFNKFISWEIFVARHHRVYTDPESDVPC